MPYHDRKSTRLNSSHGSISYAVFCLKKKKKKKTHPPTQAPHLPFHLPARAPAYDALQLCVSYLSFVCAGCSFLFCFFFFFFFLSTRRPPRSTFFPYTTRFC